MFIHIVQTYMLYVYLHFDIHVIYAEIIQKNCVKIIQTYEKINFMQLLLSNHGL
jgi:hypothetical protein